jgi:hypothetical protein
MATARTLHPTWQASATWRNFQGALALALAAIGVGGVIYLVETFGLHSERRFVENPSDVMMRAFGLAHFWIGWLFLFTSPRLRSGRSLVQLGGWTLAGTAFCLFSWSQGGMKNPFLLLAFYAYFLIHEIRDEANLFLAQGEAPPDAGRASFLRRLGISVTLTLMAAFALIYTLHGRVQEKLEGVVAAPEWWLALLTLGLLAACAGSWRATWATVRRLDIEVRHYAPLLAVYAAITSILIAGSLLGSIGFNLIVLIHVMAWFVFVRQRLANQSAPVRSWWAWLRGTATGFVVLHLVAVVVVLTLMALRVHLWERAGLISEMFATSSFHYWSIMHITMAFWKK